MRRILLVALLASAVAGAGLAGEGRPAPQGQGVPYRIIPLDGAGVTVKNWANEADPHYAIIGNLGEWQATFIPTQTMGGKKPYQPEAGLFNREALVAMSRVSDAPPPGQKVLALKSVEVVAGELVLTYSFIPPTQKASFKVKNTLLVAVPVQYLDGLRIAEEIETPDTMAAAAELEAAKAAGRVKPPALKP